MKNVKESIACFLFLCRFEFNKAFNYFKLLSNYLSLAARGLLGYLKKKGCGGGLHF